MNFVLKKISSSFSSSETSKGKRLADEPKHTGLHFGISKKNCPLAVRRNLIKRLGREYFRQCAKNLPKGRYFLRLVGDPKTRSVLKEKSLGVFRYEVHQALLKVFLRTESKLGSNR